MIKLFLLTILVFGTFTGLALFVPGSRETAFQLGSFPIPWMLIGMCVVGWMGHKALK